MDQTFSFVTQPANSRSPEQCVGADAPALVRSTAPSANQLQRLQEMIERAAALLPIPGPITSFAFLNTLQALEDLPFDEGLLAGSKMYGAQPFLPEDKYREHLATGRITGDDLAAVLREDMGSVAGEHVGDLGTRFDLRLALLKFTYPTGPAEELRWFVAEMDALTKFCSDVPAEMQQRIVADTQEWFATAGSTLSAGWNPAASAGADLADIAAKFAAAADHDTLDSRSAREALTLQALWRICLTNVAGIAPQPPRPAPRVRHRDWLLDALGEDSDLLVHDVLVRFCASFTDQGFAGWPLPHRDQGLYRAFCLLYSQHSGPATHWSHGLAEEIERLHESQVEPLESIRESLTMLGVEENQWQEYLTVTLLALRGWAGMIWQMESRPDRMPIPVRPGTLIEYLAVRLVLERLAIAHVARRTLGYRGPLSGLQQVIPPAKKPAVTNNVEQRAFTLFQLAQRLGWTPRVLWQLSPERWNTLIAKIEGFSELERRRILHRAFERRMHMRTLDAVSVFARRRSERVAAPRFQIVACIDAREESFRRHIEEVAPDAETFGAAGFFGVPVYYRGAADAHFAALCPIVIKPQHWLVEDVVYTLGHTHRRRAKARRALGTASHHVHIGSRSVAGGAILTASLGVLATVPLVARVLFPRSTARFREMTGRVLQTPTITRLRIERTEPDPGPEEGHIGFTLAEMADFGERMLRDIGLTSNFARLVLFLGHGSFSMNNPHKSVYDCGACTGNAGSPNGRALATMLNNARVREILTQRGLTIPHETVFLGALHNTCDDTVTFFDLDLLPATHYRDIAAVEQVLEAACDRNSHERCRRFDSAPLDLTFLGAHRHVERRSQDLAQARPEFGNATNALCIVGRRQRTRGLYLDRRAFLMSYDPTQDDEEHHILERILSAVVPVCEGINMQYFLSSIDSPGWGCGTKLPHNVTSLLGVMDGSLSDLRPGLPWQGVEIHEPVRLLFIIESTPAAMQQIMARNANIGRILQNSWARLAVLDADSGAIQVYQDGDFTPFHATIDELPRAASSTEWYRGRRDHLDFAVIGTAVEPTQTSHDEQQPCLTTTY